MDYFSAYDRRVVTPLIKGNLGGREVLNRTFGPPCHNLKMSHFLIFSFSTREKDNNQYFPKYFFKVFSKACKISIINMQTIKLLVCERERLPYNDSTIQYYTNISLVTVTRTLHLHNLLKMVSFSLSAIFSSFTNIWSELVRNLNKLWVLLHQEFVLPCSQEEH